jgi:hypothetical protein
VPAALTSLGRRQRRRTALAACILALGAAVVIAHGPMGLDHMGTAFAACVAVLEGTALGAAAAVALASRPAPGKRSAPIVQTVTLPAFRPPEPRARAGPPSLQVFRL